MSYLASSSPYGANDSVSFLLPPGLGETAAFTMAPGLGDVESDYANRGQWATKSGCIDASKPNRQYVQAELDKIAVVQASVSSKVNKMIGDARSAQQKYQDAASAIGADGGGNNNSSSTLSSLFSWAVAPVATAFQSSSSSSSLSLSSSKQDEGYQILRKVGDDQTDLYGDLGFLMYYAPTSAAATQICSKKNDIQSQLSQILDNISTLNQKISARETEMATSLDNLYRTIITLLEGFIGLLQALVDILKTIFSGIVAAASFSAKYPYVVWGGIGILALGIGMFALKKYVKVIKDIV